MMNRLPLRKRFSGVLIAALFLTAAFTFLVSAQGGGSFDLGWAALAGVGDRRISEHYLIEDILGQAAVGISDTATSQGGLRVVGGFFGSVNLTYSIFVPITKH